MMLQYDINIQAYKCHENVYAETKLLSSSLSSSPPPLHSFILGQRYSLSALDHTEMAIANAI
jgi:hypothetical protein